MAKGRSSSRQQAKAPKPKRWDPAWTASIAETQSRRMSHIRSKGTTPEMAVRRIVHRLGYRFRLHRRDLPGCPDLVLPRLKKVIDVRGCFWHAHSCIGNRRPTVRADYWHPKLARTVARDRRNVRRLRALGWRVLVLWECQAADSDRLLRRIARFLAGPS